MRVRIEEAKKEISFLKEREEATRDYIKMYVQQLLEDVAEIKSLEAQVREAKKRKCKTFLRKPTPHATLQDINEWIGRVGAQRGTIQDLQHL